MPDDYKNYPSFDELAAGLDDDQKHRYTQYRQALRENTIDGRVYHSPEELKAVRERAQALKSIFTKPGTDEDALFDLIMDDENEQQGTARHPLGAKYGNTYASPEAAKARMTPPPARHADGNGRPVGFLERTYGTSDPALARAAMRRIHGGK